MVSSNWVWFIVIAAVIAFLLLRRSSFARADDVEAALKDRALVIDVRSSGEFASGHLAGVTNVPLDRLAQEIAALAPDRSQPIALHCLSGARSASGCATLRRMGYTRVYNLGSYGRAEKLLTTLRTE
ncbi:MAG TPA: rhodanese-like domain-containing protein [Verrucomicrobiae bacterium]|nr:rhodanese-like domain-containing protein [Verrucomicrobiae bacterium]